MANAHPGVPRSGLAIGAWLMLALAVTLLFPGCTVGPDYAAPDPSAPADFHAASGDQPGASKLVAAPADLSRWWTVLADPLLDELTERAVGSNLDVRIASSRVREARAQRGVVAADGLPKLDATGSYSRSRGSENSVGAFGRRVNEDADGTDLFQAGFDARWELDVFGGVRRSVEAADAQVQSAEENRRDVLVSLLAEVARNYVEARTFQRRLAIAERSVGVQQDTLDLTSSRFTAGLTSELDVAQARAQLETRRSQVPPLRAGFAASVHRLGVLMGEPPATLFDAMAEVRPIPPVPPEVPIGLPSELLRRRPDVRRAERDLAAATARVGVATADLFPKFALAGSIGVQSQQAGDLFDLDSRYWSIGPSVRWPVFDAGRIRANIDVQDARQEQALLAYTKAVLVSLEESENAMTGYVQEQSRRTALAGAVASSQRALDLATQLYRGGVKDFLNVLDAQRLLFEAEDQLAQSDRAVTADLIAVYKALGGGWENPSR